MSQFPPIEPTGMVQRPHRGVMILVLGILGLVLCVICGIVAWVMGASDLKEMDAGRMDASGRGYTKAGMILGIVGVALTVVGGALLLLVSALGFLGAAAGGAAGSP
jgi:uncharacterized membrane protein YidH (DUF202 family)